MTRLTECEFILRAGGRLERPETREASNDVNSNQAWHRNYRDLFDLRPDNTFLVKIAYWLSR